MEKTDNTVNYYTLIRDNLRRQDETLNEAETTALCREIVFAPESYTVETNDKEKNIGRVREDLADFIERDSANKNFIPYSLDAEIADLIERSNCETSSINEYYRWISVTADIIRNTEDGKITREDVSERNGFITMSYEREAEILLCLALYESADSAKNRSKIDMLRFKLARLREMRSIVRNTPEAVNVRSAVSKEEFRRYEEYCRRLMEEKTIYTSNFNLKLKLNINHITEEDLEDDFSYMDYLRRVVLHMMRKLEKDSFENRRGNEQNIEPLQNANNGVPMEYVASVAKENERI